MSVYNSSRKSSVTLVSALLAVSSAAFLGVVISLLLWFPSRRVEEYSAFKPSVPVFKPSVAVLVEPIDIANRPNSALEAILSYRHSSFNMGDTSAKTLPIWSAVRGTRW